ncbi:MAG: hypothetical protein ABIJ00_10845 [Candidatus Eisenbacteria bacterium]
MASPTGHKWIFRSRFRRNAFGWRSQPAIKRIKEAVSEIKKVARKDPVLGGEGAVLFLERLSPALEHVDSSSGAIGRAVYNAIESLVRVIAEAPAADPLRDKWLERLWQAIEDDDMPYIEGLTDYWGRLCASPERATRWADRFVRVVRMAWRPDRTPGDCFKGTSACLSALFKAGRYAEILGLLELAPFKYWPDRRWGVKALAAMGKSAEALSYAEASQGRYVHPASIAEACEAILLDEGMVERAYDLYAIDANRRATYLATFHAIAAKYPNKQGADILRDLVASTPGSEGKWFAAAKSAGLYGVAIELANSTPCDPRTLTRAARDLASEEPRFAVEAGIAALRWLVEGYGYDITGLDVRAAYDHAMKAARNIACEDETRARIRELVAGETIGERFVTKILGRELGLT